jgi:hypothetical protein
MERGMNQISGTPKVCQSQSHAFSRRNNMDGQNTFSLDEMDEEIKN